MSRRQILFLLGPCAAVAVVSQPLFSKWLVWGHNCTIDLARQLELHHLIRQGISYPRWCADLYFGYGSPLFNFYAPGGYWVGEIFAFAGANALWALKLAYFCGILLAGVGMFFLVRELWGPVSGAASAILYVSAPYLLLNVYVRASIGEVLCFAWIPLTLFFFLKGLRGSRTHTVFGAFFGAAVIFTHNITALLFFPALIFFVVLNSVWSRDLRRLAEGLFGCGLALGLSALFWLPVLVEKRFVHGDQILTDGAYWYAGNFLRLSCLFEPRWGFGTGDPSDTISLQLGTLHWILLIASAVVSFWKRRLVEASHVFLWIVFGCSVFCMFSISKPFWGLFPFVRFVQFPWRLLLLATFASSALAGLAFAGLERRSWKWRAAALVGVLAATLVAYGGYVKAKFIVWDNAAGELRWVEAGDLDHIAGDPNIIPVEDYLTVERMRQTGVKATLLNDFLPIWVKETHLSLPKGSYRPVQGAFTVEPLHETPLERSYSIQSLTGGYLELFTFWFPGWVGSLDGNWIDLFPRRDTGCLGAAIPPGNHVLTVKFVNTPVRTFAERVSLVSLALAILMLVGIRVSVLNYAGRGSRKQNVGNRQ